MSVFKHGLSAADTERIQRRCQAKTYITHTHTHTKGGDQRPEIGYIWLLRPRVKKERGKKRNMQYEAARRNGGQKNQEG